MKLTLFMNQYRQNKLPCSSDKVISYNHDIHGRLTTKQLNQLYVHKCDFTFANKFPEMWYKWSYWAQNALIT